MWGAECHTLAGLIQIPFCFRHMSDSKPCDSNSNTHIFEAHGALLHMQLTASWLQLQQDRTRME